MKIPFDIKFKPQIESGEYKVETRDGKTVVGLKRQIIYGTPLLYGIIKELECCEMWKEDGTANPKMKKDNHDLFIITPEPELSEWETFISGCLQRHGLLDCGAADRIAQNCSAELLELARKEALKDLPRWRRWGNGACGNGRGIPLAIVKRGLNGYELVDVLGIQGEQYIMLSDLEKLTGFRED